LIKRSPNCAYMFDASSSWAPIGTIQDQIAPLAVGKKVFAVPSGGGLTGLDGDDIDNYVGRQAASVSYLFICPEAAISRVLASCHLPQRPANRPRTRNLRREHSLSFCTGFERSIYNDRVSARATICA
jgi:hypothetical protein